MTSSENVTPAKFRCQMNVCPSVHIAENGDIILIGSHVSDGELKNMGIVDVHGKPARSMGEGAIRLTSAFMDAYFMDYMVDRLKTTEAA